jgi:hypothetical protein
LEREWDKDEWDLMMKEKEERRIVNEMDYVLELVV